MNTITTKSAEETFDFAAEFAKHLKVGDTLLLIGDLGAGKTNFVQGFAHGLDVPDKVYVRSPTFAIINEYNGGKYPLYHFDFYRLESVDSLIEIAFDEYVKGDGITVIEWADKFIDEMPQNAIRIDFEILGVNERRLTVR